MKRAENHWKLGLFVVLSVLLGFGLALYVGTRALHEDTVTYHSYFDEPVMGLNIGAAVTFRGVAIGDVTNVDVAADRRHVEVTYRLRSESLERLGLSPRSAFRKKSKVPAGMRVQLATRGITGGRYLEIDFYRKPLGPEKELPFKVSGNTIPTEPSTIKNVEEAILRAADVMPELTRHSEAILSQINLMVSEVHEQKLPVRVASTLEAVNQAFRTIDHQAKALDAPALSQQLRTLLARVDVLLRQVDGESADMGSQKSLVASLHRATNRVSDAAEQARDLGPELSLALSDIRDAARAMRQLLATLERDPDMLLKGRAEVRE